MKMLYSRITCFSLIMLILIAFGGGCARQQIEDPSESRVSNSTNDLPLPDWAPENPSLEFLRAAAVLKPMPVETLMNAAQGDQQLETFYARFRHTWKASYELFGSLSDEQIERFRAAKKIHIPIKSLTATQRAALDNWFEVWRDTMPADSMFGNDYLVFLYKFGAEEDLSNVEVGFDVPEGAPVHLRFIVNNADVTVQRPGITFARFD